VLLSSVAPVAIPDLADFSLHKISYDVDFDGVAVPGLCGAFYRCPDGGRLLSVGIYMMDGVELFRAWGYVGEEHCAYHAVVCVDGSIDGPHIGCPDVAVVQESGAVAGLEIHTKDREYYVSLSAPTGAGSMNGDRRLRHQCTVSC
jgi:hypothetical protein